MTRTRTLLGTATLVTALAVTSGAFAQKSPGNGNGQKTDTTAVAAPVVVKASAALNIGQVKPRPKATKAGASGRFTATITGLEMKWKLTFKQLSGGDATAAHIHAGKRGVNNPAPEIVLCAATCASGATGTVVLTQPQLDAMKKGGYYVNVHTAKNPGGEIRGQVAVVGK